MTYLTAWFHRSAWVPAGMDTLVKCLWEKPVYAGSTAGEYNSCCHHLLRLLRQNPELFEQGVVLESLDALRMILYYSRAKSLKPAESDALHPNYNVFVKEMYDAFTDVEIDGLVETCQEKLVEFGILEVCLQTVTSSKVSRGRGNLDSAILRLMMAVLCGGSETVQAMFLSELNQSKVNALNFLA